MVPRHFALFDLALLLQGLQASNVTLQGEFETSQAALKAATGKLKNSHDKLKVQ